MITEFGKVFVFLLISGMLVVALVFLAKLLRPARPTKEKMLTYECGEDPEGSPWVKFNIRFYVIALIFLIFDVEVVMLIPWAMAYKEFGFGGFMVGAIFLVLLGLGMAYEWRKGDLEWDRAKIIPPMIKKPVLRQSKITQPEPQVNLEENSNILA